MEQNVSGTTVERLEKLFEERKRQAEMNQEEVDELKKACGVVFTSREGRVVAKYMAKVCGIYKFPDLDLTPMNMAFAKGMIYIYKFFVLGMLRKEEIREMDINQGGDNA